MASLEELRAQLGGVDDKIVELIRRADETL